MKYFVLGLIIVLAALGQPTSIAGQPMTYDGVASFDNQDANGVETLVSIHLQEQEKTAVLALSISRSQESCGQRPGCSIGPLFAGSATQRIADGDASVSRHLAWASVHTRLNVHDTIANGSEEVALDVQWTASDGLAPVPHGIGQAFYRDATATGMVTSPSLGAVSLASTTSGTLSRQLDG